MKLLLTKAKPYFVLMRLDKPIGSFLLLWPTLWALFIAAKGTPPLSILVIFILGVVIMRSAGCIVNDLADRKFDGYVARTRNRPLVLGSVSIKSAFLLFICLCLIAFVLVLQLNYYTVSLSVIGLFLAILYPFTKRVSQLPQLILGAAFAWSVPMAFAAVTGEVTAIAWLLFLIAVMWPFAYDTIYALMDKEDDLKIGVKSTAILFGKWDIIIICILQLLVISGLALLGYLLHFNFYFYCSLFIAMTMVCYQHYLLRSRNSKNYYKAFYNNHWLGCIVFLGIFFNYLLPSI